MTTASAIGGVPSATKMHVGAGGTPDQARLVEVGVDIDESRRAELVGVVGELALLKLVAGRSGGTPAGELLGHRSDAGSKRGERRTLTGVDIGREDRPQCRHHRLASCVDDRRDVGFDEGHPAPIVKRPVHPRRDRGLDPIGEIERERGELSLVVGERRFGLCVHVARLR